MRFNILSIAGVAYLAASILAAPINGPVDATGVVSQLGSTLHSQSAGGSGPQRASSSSSSTDTSVTGAEAFGGQEAEGLKKKTEIKSLLINPQPLVAPAKRQENTDDADAQSDNAKSQTGIISLSEGFIGLG